MYILKLILTIRFRVSIIITCCRYSSVFLIKGDKCKELKIEKDITIDEPFDYIACTMYITKKKIVRIYKIGVNEGIYKEQYDCKFINEIYRLPIHDNVLENAKNQICMAV